MKHTYTDAQLQAAIDKGFPAGARESGLRLDNKPGPLGSWKFESHYRLAIMQDALAALPEPEPPTVDGKTPGQVACEAWNNGDVWKETNYKQEWERSASAVLAAFGNQPQPAEKARLDWKFAFDKLNEDFQASEARAEKAEAELARIIEAAHEAGWNGVDNPKDLAQFVKDQAEEIQRLKTACDRMSEQEVLSLSRLRPISEAGPVPEGCVRVTGWFEDEDCIVGSFTNKKDTVFADIRLPELTEKPDPYAELKAAYAAGKVIQALSSANTWEDCDKPLWSKHGEYRIKPTPETFEAHGKTWTRHNKGDVMPCDINILVEVIDGDIILNPVRAESWNWRSGNFRGWRYADEPTPEPLEPEPWTPKVGDVVTLKSGSPDMTVTGIESTVWCCWFIDNKTQSEDFPTACLQPA